MMSTDTEAGFSLIEVIAALAIAAMIASFAFTAIRQTSTAYKRADRFEQHTNEAENIYARLEAEMPLDELEDEFPDWQFKREAVENEAPTSAFLIEIITIQHRASPRHRFTYTHVQPANGVRAR